MVQFQGNMFPDEYLFYRIYKQRATKDFVPFIESETSKKAEGNIHFFKELEIPSCETYGHHDGEPPSLMVELYRWYFFMKEFF